VFLVKRNILHYKYIINFSYYNKVIHYIEFIYNFDLDFCLFVKNKLFLSNYELSEKNISC